MSYEDWRRTVPFTDEQIATALEADADTAERNDNRFLAIKYRSRAEAVRRGRLSARDLSQVLSALARTCGICGKRALYRSGNEGRCSVHRMTTHRAAAERRARVDAQASDIQRERIAADYRDLTAEHARGHGKFGRKGKRP